MKITIEIDLPDDFAAEDDSLMSWLDLTDEELGSYAREALVIAALVTPLRFPSELVAQAQRTADNWIERERMDEAAQRMREQIVDRPPLTKRPFL